MTLSIVEINGQFAQNSIEHRTDCFDTMQGDIPALVVRRGQPFSIILKSSRHIQPDVDNITFLFSIKVLVIRAVLDEEHPSSSRKTEARILLRSRSITNAPWNVVLVSSSDMESTVVITTPPDCVVGPWMLSMITNKAHMICPFIIHILFNAWCPMDEVYMDNEEWRREAILEEGGLLFAGTPCHPRPIYWNYSQYEKDVLECSYHLITKVAQVKGSFRGQAVAVSRAVAFACGAIDDRGLLMNKYDGTYKDGVVPTAWVSSKEILMKFYHKRKPVRYGQCFVMAAVTTTVLRALGIPTRPVTGYDCAIDDGGSLNIDLILDINGKVDSRLTADTIWLFHVWTEAWMKRMDLGQEEYDGWQVLDPTPQHTSDGLLRLGPCPVAAVKKGEGSTIHDAAMVFSNLNADIIVWRYENPNIPMKIIRIFDDFAGKRISTKSAGKMARMDLTSLYKVQERSVKERQAFRKALQSLDHSYLKKDAQIDPKELECNLSIADPVNFGESIFVHLSVNNVTTTLELTLDCILRVDCKSYTGRFIETVLKKATQFKLRPKASENFNLMVTYEIYGPFAVCNNIFEASCMVDVLENHTSYFDSQTVSMKMDTLKIKMTDVPLAFHDCKAIILHKNNLPVQLTNGYFKISAPGIHKVIHKKLDRVVPLGETAKATLTFKPTVPGRAFITAKFMCDQISCSGASLEFIVKGM